MNWLKTIVLVSVIFWGQLPVEFQLLKTIPAKADFFEVDALGNIYLIKQSKLIKLNSQGEKLHEYSNPMFGDISLVDVSDPLRLLVFYRESNQIEFLNSALAEIASPIVFDEYGIYSAQVVCGSALNRIWLFDSENRQLVQYDKNMGVVQKSPAIDQIIEGDCIPDILFEKQNQVFLNCPGYGVLVFDQFGSFSKKFPTKAIKSFWVEGGDYYYQVGAEFFKYSRVQLIEEKIPIPPSKSTKLIKWRSGKLYILSEKEISIYEMKQK